VEQKQIRFQMAIELLQVLSVQSTRQWHDIVTLDKPWIYLFSEHDLMWTAPGEIVVDREWHSSITEVYADGRVESDQIPCCESPPEGAQIQHIILCK
jgi:hypothetical protein